MEHHGSSTHSCRSEAPSAGKLRIGSLKQFCNGLGLGEAGELAGESGVEAELADVELGVEEGGVKVCEGDRFAGGGVVLVG